MQPGSPAAGCTVQNEPQSGLEAVRLRSRASVGRDCWPTWSIGSEVRLACAALKKLMIDCSGDHVCPWTQDKTAQAKRIAYGSLANEMSTPTGLGHKLHSVLCLSTDEGSTLASSVTRQLAGSSELASEHQAVDHSSPVCPASDSPQT